MSGHLILNLLNELVKLILCEALPSTISVLPTSLITFSIKLTRMLDYIYHITLEKLYY